MRKEFTYTDGAVRWDLVAAMFPTTMRHGLRRSVNVLARELVGLAAQDPSFRDGQDGRDNLVLAVDAEFVDRLHRADRSTFKTVGRERNPFPDPRLTAGKLAAHWDAVMGRSHLQETFDAYPSGREVYDRILAKHNAIWDGETDANMLYLSMLTTLITTAIDELDATLHGLDVVVAARDAGIYNEELDGHGED